MELTFEQKHAVNMLRTSLQLGINQIDVLLENPHCVSKEFHEKWISQAMESQFAAMFYLWIQTGISLPTSISDEQLAEKLQSFAEHLKYMEMLNES